MESDRQIKHPDCADHRIVAKEDKTESESDSQLKRHRVFLTKWQKGRPWLKTVTSKHGEVTSMYCDVCQRHPLKPAGPGLYQVHNYHGLFQ